MVNYKGHFSCDISKLVRKSWNFYHAGGARPGYFYVKKYCDMTKMKNSVCLGSGPVRFGPFGPKPNRPRLGDPTYPNL